MSFGRFGPIFGFLPEIGQLEPIEVIAALKRGDAFPGRVGDDTAIFREAASQGATIVTVEFSYPAASVDAIQKQITDESKAPLRQYSFPKGKGDDNCVTWLIRLGLQLPDETGQMIDLVTELEPLRDAEPIEVD